MPFGFCQFQLIFTGYHITPATGAVIGWFRILASLRLVAEHTIATEELRQSTTLITVTFNRLSASVTGHRLPILSILLRHNIRQPCCQGHWHGVTDIISHS